MGGGRKGGVHLLDLTGLDDRTHVHFFVQRAAVVGDARQIPGPLPVQCGQQIAGHPDAAESWRHEDGTIGNIGNGLVEITVDFVLHLGLLLGGNLPYILPHTVNCCHTPERSHQGLSIIPSPVTGEG